MLTIRNMHKKHSYFSNIYHMAYPVISLLNSYLDLNCVVLHAATGSRYVDKMI